MTAMLVNQPTLFDQAKALVDAQSRKSNSIVPRTPKVNPLGLPGSRVSMFLNGEIVFPAGSLADDVVVSVELKDERYRLIQICEITSYMRRRGRASSALRQLCEWADANKYTFDLLAMPIIDLYDHKEDGSQDDDERSGGRVGGPKSLDVEELRSWFGKFGFVATGRLDTMYDYGYAMRRVPGAGPSTEEKEFASTRKRNRLK